MAFQKKMKRDLTTVMKFIKNHPSSKDIYNLFMKGPDPDHGFMWTSTEWWTPAQQRALSIVNMKVVELKKTYIVTTKVNGKTTRVMVCFINLLSNYIYYYYLLIIITYYLLIIIYSWDV